MASIRTRKRRDGSPYYSVLYTHRGRQSSVSFNNEADAESVCDLINRVGVERALVLSWELVRANPLT